jgi:hypothetical protein
MSRQAKLLSIWVVCSFVAALLSLEQTTASYIDGVWVPAGNDSFYHARRILDAAFSERGFYQFDNMIHVPEGSWITWPWAYDWMMAKGLVAWQAVFPDTDAMAFLTHVPVYWIFVNTALLVGIAETLNLRSYWIALIGLGFALSPLTQLLHGVGSIDHHFVELTFVLLVIFTGLRWFNSPDQSGRAAWLGIALGMAPAFHNGLFILQVPVLLCLFIFWIRRALPPSDAMLALAISLILTTLLALLPSEPFRDGQFQFSLLSWFHLYIAAISTLIISGLARFGFSLKNLILLGGIGILLLIPIWADTIGGTAFLTRDIILLEKIAEAQSPLTWSITRTDTLNSKIYYSWFGVFAPLLPILFLWRLWRTDDRTEAFLAVMIIFGIGLGMMQFRLHYFGSFALVLGWVVLINKYFPTINKRPWVTFIAAFTVFAIAYQPSVQYRLFSNYSLGFDSMYQHLYPMLQDASVACEEDPGIILIDNNFGHLARYHTDCSVIANNFLMTPLHEKKIKDLLRLLQMTPEELLAQDKYPVKYVLARLQGFVGTIDGQPTYATTTWLEANLPRLQFDLNTRKDLPERFEVLSVLPLEDSERDLTIAVLMKILPDETATLEE